jgi:hypothetical protein
VSFSDALTAKRMGARDIEARSKVALGCRTNIRLFQRRAYGPRDEEYLRLKVFLCMLPQP